MYFDIVPFLVIFLCIVILVNIYIEIDNHIQTDLCLHKNLTSMIVYSAKEQQDKDMAVSNSIHTKNSSDTNKISENIRRSKKHRHSFIPKNQYK